MENTNNLNELMRKRDAMNEKLTQLQIQMKTIETEKQELDKQIKYEEEREAELARQNRINNDISKEEFIKRLQQLFIYCINSNSHEQSAQFNERLTLLIIERIILNGLSNPVKNETNIDDKFMNCIIDRKEKIDYLIDLACNPNGNTIGIYNHDFGTYSNLLNELFEDPKLYGNNATCYTDFKVRGTSAINKNDALYLFKNLLVQYYYKILRYSITVDKDNDLVPSYYDANARRGEISFSPFEIETKEMFERAIGPSRKQY